MGTVSPVARRNPFVDANVLGVDVEDGLTRLRITVGPSSTAVSSVEVSSVERSRPTSEQRCLSTSSLWRSSDIGVIRLR